MIDGPIERGRRQFSIELGEMVMRAIAEGLHPDDALLVLKQKVGEEMRLQRERKEAARSY